MTARSGNSPSNQPDRPIPTLRAWPEAEARASLPLPPLPGTHRAMIKSGSSSIWTELDFDKAGKQVGRLHLPYSVTRSA